MDLWDPNHSPETKAAIEHWERVQWFPSLRDDNLELIAQACDQKDDLGRPVRVPEGWRAQSELGARLLAWRRQGTGGPFR